MPSRALGSHFQGPWGPPPRAKSGHFAKDILQKPTLAQDHSRKPSRSPLGSLRGPSWHPLGSHLGAQSSSWLLVRPSARAQTRLTFVIDSIFYFWPYFSTCSHSRTKSPFLPRMAISFESESKNQMFTLKGVLDASMTAWTPPRRLQGAPRPILVDFGSIFCRFLIDF